MSTLKADTIQNTSGGAVTLTKQQAAKMWVNLNGTGTIAILDSFNVGGATDNGTGDFTFSFNSSMANTSYSAIGDAQSNNLSCPLKNTGIHTLATGSERHNFGAGSSESGKQDIDMNTVMVSGDLA